MKNGTKKDQLHVNEAEGPRDAYFGKPSANTDIIICRMIPE